MQSSTGSVLTSSVNVKAMLRLLHGESRWNWCRLHVCRDMKWRNVVCRCVIITVNEARGYVVNRPQISSF